MFGQLIEIPDNYFENTLESVSNANESMQLKKFSGAEIFIKEHDRRLFIIYDDMKVDNETMYKLYDLLDAFNEMKKYRTLPEEYDFIIPSQGDKAHLKLAKLFDDCTLYEFISFYDRY